MAEFQSDFGIQTTGDNINFRLINNQREEDTIISTLFKNELENKNIVEENIDPFIYLNDFNAKLKQNSLKIFFSLEKDESTNKLDKSDKKSNKKSGGKSKEPSKKEQLLLNIKKENEKKNIAIFIDSISVDNNVIISFRSNIIESYYTIIYWAIFLLKNIDKNINISYYINCARSLYKTLNNCTDILPEIMKEKTNYYIEKIEKFIYSKLNQENLFITLVKDPKLLLESLWDKYKPKSIALYDEQRNVINTVLDKLKNSEPSLIFYDTPPANGKTLLSAFLAKKICDFNKNNKSVPGFKNKSLLYICYNSIVRTEVAKICITPCVDIKFWFAYTKMDEDGIIKTFLRPYKTCYPDWNKRGPKVSETVHKKTLENRKKKYSENIHVQWEYFLEETRTILEKRREIDDYETANLPQMVISDLESAYVLLKEFPDVFIPYFDETFAAANLMINAKIMKVLPKISLFVSATLPKIEEIPTIINDFKLRHNINDDSYLSLIKSDRQNISCTFINADGYIFAPHDKINNIEELYEFLELFKINPLIKRGYSPETVFSMVSKIDIYLTEDLKFKNKFPYLGTIDHGSLRNYAYDILSYINETKNEEIFKLMKENHVQKISNMELSKLLTKNAINYQEKTLHVASSKEFNIHVENMAKDFIEGSPKIISVFTTLDREKAILEKSIADLQKNGNKDSKYEIDSLTRELGDLKLQWPMEYILNSREHAIKNGNASHISVFNREIFSNKDDLSILDDTRAKLLISGIGVYQPEIFSMANMELFLTNKDRFKFIISTPSIVYGTNIGLSIIDIDSSFSEEATKNKLYQLIGRGGRMGKSNSAIIIFRDNNMINKIINKDEVNIEALQIEANYQKLE